MSLAAVAQSEVLLRSSANATVLQQQASDPLYSVWVGASAGSGKTTVLTSRVIRLLLAGVAPHKILCLTFTRAAAAEMAIRITDRLKDWATCDDDRLRADLNTMQGDWPEPSQMVAARRLFAEVLTCPGGMRILTIHAFAQEVLKRFPIEAGLPPHFSVLPDSDAAALEQVAQNAVLQQAATAPASVLGKALQRLVQNLGEYKFTNVMRQSAKERDRLTDVLANIGGAARLEQRLRAELDLSPDDSEAEFLARAAAEGSFARADLTHFVRTVLEKGSSTYTKRAAIMRDWLAQDVESRAANLETYCRAFFTDSGKPYAEPANAKLLTQHPELAEIFQLEARRLESLRERLDSLRIAEDSAALGIVMDAISIHYAERKRQEAALDYGDQIQRTAALLRRPGIAPWILYKLDGGLDHILVDEAQDTSALQWEIVKILAEEFFAGQGAAADRQRTLFVVGDEKQSIYRFQGADPEAFLPMLDYFRNRITTVTDQFREVPLNISFRSAPAVLRAVDAIFAAERTRQGVAHEVVQHTPHRQSAAGRVELWSPITAVPKQRDWQLPLDYRHEADAESQLAALLATQIHAWLDTGRMVRGRSVQPGDIMILVRRRGRLMTRLVRELKQRAVPVAGVDRMLLTEQLPVMDLLALLQFSLLPDDDLNLATVLRGPLLGASEELLMRLAIGRSGTLWQSLEQQVAGDASLSLLHDYLCTCLRQADRITPFEMIAFILHSACPADKISGRRALWRRLGPDALDPLDELLNAAQDYSTRYSPSLQGFLHWLRVTESEVKRELAQSVGQVKISTVHAAKGLEAPIVFLPDTVTPPRKQDMPALLWHEGSGLPYYLPREPLNGSLRAMREQERARQLEEYRRLMYVALTRAADELYICGWNTQHEDKQDNSWYRLIEMALLPLSETRDSVALPEIQPMAILADTVLPSSATAETRPVSPAMPDPPAWLWQKVAPEPENAAALQPSHLLVPEPALASPMDWRFARGRIIHRLLQSLPDVANDKRESAALRFLANPQFALDASAKQAIANEVLALLRDPGFAPLFGPGSRAEVPLTGTVGSTAISGQVDRLLVLPDSVWIIDFKSNRPPPDTVAAVPEAYRAQMAAYHVLLQQIYPGRLIRSFLLWTYTPKLMELTG